jgi:hypothetical protein
MCGGQKSVGLSKGKSIIKQNAITTVALKTFTELMFGFLVSIDVIFLSPQQMYITHWV